MGKAGYSFKEVRILFEAQLTHVYVLLEAHGDCPIGVHGWHHKAFSASVSGLDALRESADAVMWVQDAPSNFDHSKTGEELIRFVQLAASISPASEAAAALPLAASSCLSALGLPLVASKENG